MDDKFLYLFIGKNPLVTPGRFCSLSDEDTIQRFIILNLFFSQNELPAKKLKPSTGERKGIIQHIFLYML